MTAVFALVGEVIGNLRLLWQEITFGVIGNFSIRAFGVTTFTAQNPFRIGSHVESLLSSMPLKIGQILYPFLGPNRVSDPLKYSFYLICRSQSVSVNPLRMMLENQNRTKGKDHEIHAPRKLSLVRIVPQRYL
jgi:hypothetical protein